MPPTKAKRTAEPGQQSVKKEISSKPKVASKPDPKEEIQSTSEGLTFPQKVKAFMQTGYSLALGLALCLILMIAIAVIYSMYLEAYEKAILQRTIEKIRTFLVQKEPLLQSASDEDILMEAQKLADELATLTKKTDELDIAIGDITNKLRLDWVPFKGSIYSFKTYTSNWADAKVFCEKENATLTCIDNEDEQKYIIQQLQVTHESSWSGICFNNGWKCYDGTPVVTEYWADKEPWGENHCCVNIQAKCQSEKNCWGAAPVEMPRRALCERKPDKKWSK